MIRDEIMKSFQRKQDSDRKTGSQCGHRGWEEYGAEVFFCPYLI